MTIERAPQVGDVWREVDPRFDRFVRVLQANAPEGATHVCIQTVVRDAQGVWDFAPRSRSSWVLAARFNGKSGGYEFKEAGRGHGL